jgi:hypothetical protein
MLYHLKMNEMKQICKFFVATAAIAASMTACSSEEILPDVQPVLERSNLTIILNNNEAATKAVKDDNAVTQETTISSVSLFVFGSATKAEADTTFEYSGIVAGTNDNEYEATFHRAPVGSKNIYVGVNLPVELHSFIRDNGVAAVYTLASLTDLNKLYPAADKGFPMFSDGTNSPVKNIEQGKKNELDVSVKRFVSKVTLETSADFEADQNGERTINGMTVDKALTFAMGQMNTKFFPFPQKSGNQYIDPNYSAIINGNALNYQTDFINEFYDFKGNQDWTSTTNGVFDKFKDVTVNGDASDIGKFKPGYVLENTNEHKLKGELTYAAVKAKFTPKFTHTYTPSGVTAKENTTNKNDFKKLYVFNNGGTYYYFEDEQNADAYKQANSIGYLTYVDCICFYSVYLNPKEYDVNRNDYYKVVITKVARLGDPYPGPNDPTLELGGEADLEVTITVQQWNKITQDTVLGKE